MFGWSIPMDRERARRNLKMLSRLFFFTEKA